MTLDKSKSYRVTYYPGLAFRFVGWDLKYDSSEGEWVENTSRALMVAVGDDYKHRVDPEDVEEIDELDYCAECGQIGCCCDGRDRD